MERSGLSDFGDPSQSGSLATRLGREWLMLDNAHSLILEDQVLPYRAIASFGGHDDPASINIAAM